MNQKQIRAAVEAMLFAAADPISADKLAQAVQLPQASVEAALEDLRTRYQREDSGLCLLHLDTRWQLSVTSLLEKGLIEEAGRLDLPGHPVSFRTTDVFLRCFGLSSLADLPPVHSAEDKTTKTEEANE